MIDCLLIGFNSSNFEDFVNMVRFMGTDSGAFKDLDLAFIDYDGKPRQSMDVLNHFYAQGRGGAHRPFHNADFMWPVITYLGTYLHRRGLKFDYVNLFQQEREQLKEKLLNEDIMTVAITTTLYVSPHPIMEVISFIRKHNKKAKIIVGGPYVSNTVKVAEDADLQSLLRYIGADFYVISSEGEAALVNLINALKAGTSLADVDNIAYRADKGYVLSKASIESNRLEDNMVDYALFPRAEFGEFVSTRTAKSCPFTCSFCAFPERAGKYTYEGVETVERELDAIRDLGGITTVTFIDDTFNVPKKRFKEILRMMIRNNYGFKWNSTYRCDHGDEETIGLMAEAGCEGVFLGIESGSDAMLKTMNKTAKRADYMKAIPLLSQAGISTYASLVVGFPTETYETIQETVDLIEEARPDYFRAQLWYCDPVTPIWREREKYGIKGTAFNWSHDTMDAKTACDLIDRMFLGIENSVWLPQNGFEQWSTFYLQRKGMSAERIKTFLKVFNTAIKEKILYPGKKEVDADLLESLRVSCQFDRPEGPDMRPVEVLSGARYVAAERFWVDEFGGARAPARADGEKKEAGPKSRRGQAAFALDEELLAGLRSNLAAGLLDVLLAAYSATLSRLAQRPETDVVCAAGPGGGRTVVPLRLSPARASSFAEFTQAAGSSRLQASEHARYAFHILTNPARMGMYGCGCPEFEFGFAYGDEGPAAAAAGLAESLKYYPAALDGLSLLCCVEDEGRRARLHLSYAEDLHEPRSVQRIGEEMVSLLREVCADPGAPLRAAAPAAPAPGYAGAQDVSVAGD